LPTIESILVEFPVGGHLNYSYSDKSGASPGARNLSNAFPSEYSICVEDLLKAKAIVLS